MLYASIVRKLSFPDSFSCIQEKDISLVVLWYYTFLLDLLHFLIAR
jgi:hypothetical protein